MSARASRRRRADPLVGSMVFGATAGQPHGCISSSACASEGMMTRAKRRRVLAESTKTLERSSEAFFQDPAGGLPDWRDWANLPPELVEDIAGRLLPTDVSEYLRFRAVCKPWRNNTDDPRGRAPLDSRFRPRSWVVVTITPDAGSRRRLLNLTTAASLAVDLPVLKTHCHLCAVDGLLVLFNNTTRAICLLDPLCNTLTEFPAINSIAAPPSSCRYLPGVFLKLPGCVREAVCHISGAAFDDSTSPPTLLLCLRGEMYNIIFAKPGDAHWTVVDHGDAFLWMEHRVFERELTRFGKYMFQSLLSLGGRCYIASPEGSVYLVQLWPLPKLVVVVDQQQAATSDAISQLRIRSYLFHSVDGRMMMVRYRSDVEHFGGREAFNQMELFTVGSITGCFEVLEVDIVQRRFVPVKSLGRHAVFIGKTHSLLVSADTFPSIAADAIYMGMFDQFRLKFSMYNLSSRKTEPPHRFSRDKDRRVVPSVRPCNLDQYLITYVERVHMFSGLCINHLTHS